MPLLGISYIYSQESTRGRDCLRWNEKCFYNGTKVCYSRCGWRHQRKVCHFRIIFGLQ